MISGVLKHCHEKKRVLAQEMLKRVAHPWAEDKEQNREQDVYDWNEGARAGIKSVTTQLAD